MLLEQDGLENKGKSGRQSKGKNRAKKKHRPYGKEINYYSGLQHVCGGYYKVRAPLALGVARGGRPTFNLINYKVKYLEI